MVFLNRISFKYYENLAIYYILYYLDIHQKESKFIQPLFLNTGAQSLFVARSITILCKCREPVIVKISITSEEM